MAGRLENGFSLTELVVVIVLGGILLGAAVPIFIGTTTRSNADAAAHLVAQELAYARILAVGNHANILFQVTPSSNYVAVAPGTGSARGPFSLPNGIQFQSSAFSPDTPDTLGSVVLGAGGYAQMTFTDNGSVVQDPALNNICSGTFFLQHANGDPDTRRAVTVMGGTGRTRIWRYDANTNTWK